MLNGSLKHHDLSWVSKFNRQQRLARGNCRKPKGFAFIEFVDERDAEDAKTQVDGSMLDGR